jgi:CRP/FNR family transcriptional regulator, cyclic AMP receptor protein
MPAISVRPVDQRALTQLMRARPGYGAGTADKLAILRRHSLFGQLSPAMIERLGFFMKRRSLPRRSVILAKGEPGTGLMGVLAGAVKISVLSADGREIVLSIMREGDIFGEIALLDGHPLTADATAMTDCELMVIERRDFIPCLRSQADLTIQIIEILCSRLRRTTEQVQDVTFLNLPTRLAKTLLRLTADAKRPGSAPKVALTQRDIQPLIRPRIVPNRTFRAWLHVHAGGAGFASCLNRYSQPSAERVVLIPETSHFFDDAFLRSRHCTPPQRYTLQTNHSRGKACRQSEILSWNSPPRIQVYGAMWALLRMEHPGATVI